MVEQRDFHAATLLPEGTVLVVGGGCCGQDRSLASAELYDPHSGSWRATGSMKEARAYVTATLLPDGRVLVAGGGEFRGVGLFPLASAELYDPADGTWTATASLNAGHGRLFSTDTLLLDGTVLAAGGSGKGYLASAEVYDPANGIWTATAEMHEPREGHTATLLRDGTLLVAGGDISSSKVIKVLASAELYDPGSGGQD